MLLCYVGESRFEVRSETDSNNVGEHCRDEQTAPYLRTTCDEPFARRGRLNSRKQAHSPVNVYICSECQKRFYRAMLCIRGTSHGPVSVCPSVTSRCSTKTAKRRITQTTPHDSPRTLVSLRQRFPRNSTGVTPYEGAECRWGGSKSATFDK